MRFPRQKYWSRLPFPLRDLPDLGIKPASPAVAGGFFTIGPPEKRPPRQKKGVVKKCLLPIYCTYLSQSIVLSFAKNMLIFMLVKI